MAQFDAKLSDRNNTMSKLEMMTISDLEAFNNHSPKKFDIQIRQKDEFYEIHIIIHSSKRYQVLVTGARNPKRWKSLDTILKFIAENCENYANLDIILGNNDKINVIG